MELDLVPNFTFIFFTSRKIDLLWQAMAIAKSGTLERWYDGE